MKTILFRLRSSPLLIIFGFVLVFVVAWSLLEDARSRQFSWENVPAAALTLQSLDGKTINLSDYKGKVVLLDFWATWCGPCRQSIPGILEIYKKHRDEGFQVIGPALEHDDGHNIPAAVSELKIDYPVGLPKREQVEAFVPDGSGITLDAG